MGSIMGIFVGVFVFTSHAWGDSDLTKSVYQISNNQIHSESVFQISKFRNCAYCALKRARFGNTDKEHAFWFTELNGEYKCHFWGDSGNQKRKVSTNKIPSNALVLFHTHPRDSAIMNDHDIKTAEKISEKYIEDILFVIVAGNLTGYIDPLSGIVSGQTKKVPWHSNEPWKKLMTDDEKDFACDYAEEDGADEFRTNVLVASEN